MFKCTNEQIFENYQRGDEDAPKAFTVYIWREIALICCKIMWKAIRRLNKLKAPPREGAKYSEQPG